MEPHRLSLMRLSGNNSRTLAQAGVVSSDLLRCPPLLADTCSRMGLEEQKDRLAWWSIVVASLVCIAVGAAFVGLLSGHHTAGVLLIAAGVVGLLGLLNLRRSLSRSRS